MPRRPRVTSQAMHRRTMSAALHERRVAPRVVRHNGRGGPIYDGTATKTMATAGWCCRRIARRYLSATSLQLLTMNSSP